MLRVVGCSEKVVVVRSARGWVFACVLWAGCGVTASAPDASTEGMEDASQDAPTDPLTPGWAWVPGRSQVPETLSGDPEPVELWLENTGSVTWTQEGFGLGVAPGNSIDVTPEEGSCAAPCVVPLPGDVRPGQRVVVRFEVSGAPGARTLALTMYQGDVRFGDAASWPMEVCSARGCGARDMMEDAPDMPGDMPEDVGEEDMPEDMSEDMPAPEAVYCQVMAEVGLNLRACSPGVEPGAQACATVLESLGHRSFVASLEEHPGGWRRVRSLATGQEGWASGDFLVCPAALPEDLCPPPTTAAERVAMCSSALLSARARPLEATDLLYYVNRWYSIDKCYPMAPANEANLRPYLEPALADRCGTYVSDLVTLPASYTSSTRSLRLAAWDAPAPAGPAQTYDGRPVGHLGRVGFKAMFDAAQAEAGYRYVVVSGFRSAETQYGLFNGYVAREGSVDRASVFSAKPTHSEHQLGTTADVTFVEGGQQFNAFGAPYTFTTSPQGRWIMENAHRFGVVTTYEPHKVEAHQYQAEPWHLRFVGVEAADVMRACDLNTEELLAARYQIPELPAFGAMELVYQRMASKGYPVCRR